VASLLHTQNSSDPGDDLVRRRVGGLVEVDHTISVAASQRHNIREKKTIPGTGAIIYSYRMYSFRSRLRGEQPLGMGV